MHCSSIRYLRCLEDNTPATQATQGLAHWICIHDLVLPKQLSLCTALLMITSALRCVAHCHFYSWTQERHSNNQRGNNDCGSAPVVIKMLRVARMKYTQLDIKMNSQLGGHQVHRLLMELPLQGCLDSAGRYLHASDSSEPSTHAICVHQLGLRTR